MTRPSFAAALAALTTVAFTTFDAHAGDEITNLEKSLAEEHAALSTADCSAACRALASIRRAADRICALEPGKRCTAARAKAEDATRRVRDACPECAVLSTAPPEPVPPPLPVTPATPQPDREASSKGGTPTTANAPPSESSRGGCASCDVGGASPADCTAGALAILALARVLRRRKKLPITGE